MRKTSLAEPNGSPPAPPARGSAISVVVNAGTPLPDTVVETLQRTGLEPRLQTEASLAPGDATLCLFDGLLQPAHAKLLRRELPTLFLATNVGGTRPQQLELNLLTALLARRSLIEGVPWQVTERVSDLARVLELSKQIGALSPTASGAISDVTYELLVNAMLDAPVDTNGEHKYAHRRNEVKVTAPEDACELRATVIDSRVVVVVRDRFGRLTVDPVARTVEGLAGKARVDSSGGGAGLGMRRILEQTDTLAFRVVPNRLTEVFCVLDAGGGRRRGQPKSLFFLRE